MNSSQAPSTAYTPASPAAPGTPVAPAPATPPPSPAALQRVEGRRYLDLLTPAQQSQLFGWLSGPSGIPHIARTCALPPPEGFGHPVGLTTLVRLRAHVRAGRFNETLQIWNAQFEETEPVDPAALQRSQTLIITLLHKAALDLSQTEPSSPAFPTLVEAITKILNLDFRRQALGLQQARLDHARLQATAPAAPRRHQVDLNILPPPARPLEPRVEPPPTPEPARLNPPPPSP